MTQIKTPEEITEEVIALPAWMPTDLDHEVEDWARSLIVKAIWADRAQRDEVIEKVRAYAADRAAHARHPILNQVGSGRIASDLFQILGLPYPFPEDEEGVES